MSAEGSCFSVPVKDVPSTGVNTELWRALFVDGLGDTNPATFACLLMD